MKRFNPSLRVDQEREYYTSVHGKLLKEGVTQVATCISATVFTVSDPLPTRCLQFIHSTSPKRAPIVMLTPIT